MGDLGLKIVGLRKTQKIVLAALSLLHIVTNKLRALLYCYVILLKYSFNNNKNNYIVVVFLYTSTALYNCCAACRQVEKVLSVECYYYLYCAIYVPCHQIHFVMC
jgi:hypothetical protein